ncbi:phosphoenolpyruvate--protein phosphotransferase [uncultured Negativibacillus sp.]|uniref:phosphoenolpyruvate--protein phosphotransferase n=1 Tax=uncultured Negativibacillus sp. TaxID=1980696 RepID=UPI0025FE3A40|nr:phosphoenolpyruvate--protein phosphotransferase [uncultured Negativibacillus sp.]
MKKGTGRPVFSGVAIGRAYIYKKQQAALPTSCGDASVEQRHFEEAKEEARAQLQALFEKTCKEIGEEQGMIIDVQMMMLDDLDYLESIEAMIKNGASAAEAVKETGDTFAAAFAAMDDDYMKARAVDVKDVSTRIVTILCGGKTGFSMEEPGILVAEDLTPSETVQMPKDKILAFVTRQGSSNSHTAILARIMNIPSLVQTQINLDDEIDGKQMIVDGFEGCYYIEPDEQTLAVMKEKRHATEEYRQQLEAYRGKESVTRGGRKINLFANIGNPDDLVHVIEGDAEGVGLMRSEFLYLGRTDFPTEEELFEAYKKVVEGLGGRRVVIRTLDIGADKQADYFGLEHEENPALGLRGIRICLEREDVFRPQMRAIYRASAYGPVSVMFPMIASLWEVRKVKEFCAKIREELIAEGVAVGEVELGIMIETPAAAIMSAQLAKEVDFFSVGTNDLTQYTLAIDRQNPNLDAFYDAHHPAVLELLRQVAHNAHEAGIWAGICGELGADASLTETFLEMGYDELSVSPGRVLELRKKVCESEVQ